MHAKKTATPAALTVKEGTPKANESSTSSSQDGGLDKEKVLKVSQDQIGGEDYSALRLGELFQEFGKVEDVVIRISASQKGSALVVMALKDALVSLISSPITSLLWQ